MIEKNTCQQYFSGKIIPTTKLLKRAKDYFAGLCDSERKVLSLFISFGRAYNDLFFRQEYVARAIGISLSQAHRIIKKFCRDGIIAKKYNHMKTSNYRVTDFLVRPSEEIFRILILFCMFSLSSLQSRPIVPPYYPKPVNSSAVHNNNITNNIGDVKVCFDSKYLYLSSWYSINRRQNMNEFRKEDFVHEVVDSLRTMNLTWEQKFKLSSFPTAALNKAKEKIGRSSSYPWFKSLCEEYCIKNNLKPDWRGYYQACEVFGVEGTRSNIDHPKPEQPTKPAQSYKKSAGYSELAHTHPGEVFLKQYRQMHTYSFNRIVDPETWWKLGVENLVVTSFLGYCGADIFNVHAPKLHPDEILLKLDAIYRSDSFRQIQSEFGHEITKKFLTICVDAVLKQQEKALGKEWVREISTDQIDVHRTNLNDFVASSKFSDLCEVLGFTEMMEYMQQLLSNWTKMVGA